MKFFFFALFSHPFPPFFFCFYEMARAHERKDCVEMRTNTVWVCVWSEMELNFKFHSVLDRKQLSHAAAESRIFSICTCENEMKSNDTKNCVMKQKFWEISILLALVLSSPPLARRVCVRRNYSNHNWTRSPMCAIYIMPTTFCCVSSASKSAPFSPTQQFSRILSNAINVVQSLVTRTIYFGHLLKL